jgi:hypothetical protein
MRDYSWISLYIIIMPFSNNIQINESLTEVQQGKHVNVAGSIWLNLSMDGSYSCKLPSTPPSTGFSRIHIKHELVNFRFFNICGCVHMAIIMEPSMWHVIAIPWKAFSLKDSSYTKNPKLWWDFNYSIKGKMVWNRRPFPTLPLHVVCASIRHTGED